MECWWVLLFLLSFSLSGPGLAGACSDTLHLPSRNVHPALLSLPALAGASPTPTQSYLVGSHGLDWHPSKVATAPSHLAGSLNHDWCLSKVIPTPWEVGSTIYQHTQNSHSGLQSQPHCRLTPAISRPTAVAAGLLS